MTNSEQTEKILQREYLMLQWNTFCRSLDGGDFVSADRIARVHPLFLQQSPQVSEVQYADTLWRYSGPEYSNAFAWLLDRAQYEPLLLLHHIRPIPHHAAALGAVHSLKKVVNYLESKGLDPLRTSHGTLGTPLHAAIRNGAIESVVWILDRDSSLQHLKDEWNLDLLAFARKSKSNPYQCDKAQKSIDFLLTYLAGQAARLAIQELTAPVTFGCSAT